MHFWTHSLHWKRCRWWDEKIPRGYPGSGGALRISSDRDDRMGAKIETQKILWTKMWPKKNPCRISEPWGIHYGKREFKWLYSGTPLTRSPMGQKKLAVLTRMLFFFYKKTDGCFVGRPKKVAVITRWPSYRGSREAGFQCTGDRINGVPLY